MSTLTPLLASAAFLTWAAGSLVAVGGWLALALKEARPRSAPRPRAVPPFLV